MLQKLLIDRPAFQLCAFLLGIRKSTAAKHITASATGACPYFHQLIRMIALIRKIRRTDQRIYHAILRITAAVRSLQHNLAQGITPAQRQTLVSRCFSHKIMHSLRQCVLFICKHTATGQGIFRLQTLQQIRLSLISGPDFDMHNSQLTRSCQHLADRRT